jgi:hypothetical protein
MIISNRILKNLYIVLACTFLFVCATPYLLLAQYTEAFTDDYTIGLVLKRVNFFEAQFQWYTSWTGRYTAHALASLLHPIAYGNLGGLWIFAILMQGVFYSSLYFFIKSLLPQLPKVPRLFVFAIITLQYFWLIPSTSEAFNWIPASFSYQLGASLNLVFFGLLLKNKERTKRSRLFLILLTLIIPGTSEINLFIFCSGLFITTAFYYWNDKKIDRFLSLLLGIGVFFSLFSLLAPGNSNRTSIIKEMSVGKPGDILFAIKAAIIISKQQIMMWILHSPFLVNNVLFLCALFSTRIRPSKKPNMFLISLFFFGFIGTYLFLHVLFPFKTGIIYMPERLLNVTSLFFIICWFAFITMLWFAFSFKNEQEKVSENYSNTFSGATLVMLGLFCFSQLLIPNKIQNAWRDLLSGDAKRYSEQVHSRIRLMKESKGKHLHIAPINSMPHSICASDIKSDSLHWSNQAVAEYFELGSIQIDSTLTYK